MTSARDSSDQEHDGIGVLEPDTSPAVRWRFGSRYRCNHLAPNRPGSVIGLRAKWNTAVPCSQPRVVAWKVGTLSKTHGNAMQHLMFGVFDHMDDAGRGLARQFEERLQIAEACEAARFRAYHVAEHHGTPHGIASSPNLFLAAMAQRTTRLRLGPLVMLLNLYHPLRAFGNLDARSDQRWPGRDWVLAAALPSSSASLAWRLTGRRALS